jgi:quercetin dioxygenase-like cupin family protein
MTQSTETLPAHLFDASEEQVYNHIGALCRVIARGGMTGGGLSIVEERARNGYMTARHIHDREAETHFVLSGELEGWAGGLTHTVAEGNLLFLPAGQEHAFRVTSPTAHWLTMCTPAGFETFFEDSGVPLDHDFGGDLPIPSPLSPEEVAALQEILTPLGCTATGPPPFDMG